MRSWKSACLTVLVFFLMALPLMLPGFAAPVPSTDTVPLMNELLDGIQKRYSGKSFSADFSQVSTLTALDMTEVASGRAWFSHPGRMKWRYLSPERHDIITNGKELWIYRPMENQVMTGDASQFFQSGAGGAFLSDIRLMRTLFTVSVKEETDTWVDLTLTPRTPDPDISSIIIRVFRITYVIQQVTTVNSFGDTTKIHLSNVEFQSMPEGWFDFKIPEGVNTLNMSE